MKKNKRLVDNTTLHQEKYGKMSHLRADEAREKDADVMTEEVLQSGQDSDEKGAKAVKQLEKRDSKSRQEAAEKTLNKLDSKKKRKFDYMNQLADGLHDILKMLEVG